MGLVLYCCKALSWALDVSLVVVPDMFLLFIFSIYLIVNLRPCCKPSSREVSWKVENLEGVELSPSLPRLVVKLEGVFAPGRDHLQPWNARSDVPSSTARRVMQESPNVQIANFYPLHARIFLQPNFLFFLLINKRMTYPFLSISLNFHLSHPLAPGEILFAKILKFLCS